MSRALWLAPAAVMGLVIVASAGKAAAHVESDNGCQGSGTFREKGLAVDAEAIGDEVVTIPRSDTVDWDGSVAAPPGAYSGRIAVDLPPPFSELVVDTWKGTSENTSNSGARKYNFPKLVPAGVEFQVVGYHTDQNGYCNGYVNLQIDGGPFDSPVTPISLVATVATGAGLFGTLRPLFRRGATL
jgi:hypothetical protein